MSRSHPAQPRLRTVFAFRLSSLGGSEPWVAVKHEAIDPPSAIGATEAAGGSSRPARLGLILGGILTATRARASPFYCAPPGDGSGAVGVTTGRPPREGSATSRPSMS